MNTTLKTAPALTLRNIAERAKPARRRYSRAFAPKCGVATFAGCIAGSAHRSNYHRDDRFNVDA